MQEDEEADGEKAQRRPTGPGSLQCGRGETMEEKAVEAEEGKQHCEAEGPKHRAQRASSAL